MHFKTRDFGGTIRFYVYVNRHKLENLFFFKASKQTKFWSYWKNVFSFHPISVINKKKTNQEGGWFFSTSTYHNNIFAWWLQTCMFKEEMFSVTEWFRKHWEVIIRRIAWLNDAL